MKILHMVCAAPFGGAQRIVIDLAAAQRSAGLSAGILWLNATAGDRHGLSAGDNDLFAGGSHWSRVRAVRRILREHRPDVVHLHIPPPWLGVALPTSRRFALVSHLHVRPTLHVHRRTFGRTVTAWLNGALLIRSDRLVAVSAWVEAAWRKAYPGRDLPVQVIYNGVTLPHIEAEASPAQPARRFTVGMASRLSDRKGVEEFIDLAARIHELAPEIRFEIAGEGSARQLFETQARNKGLADVLVFRGFIADMASFWSGLDLAAFTAPFEPFGLRLIEPIAHRVPVVGYRNQSGSDEIIDCCRGVAAVPYADVEGLAREVLRLADAPRERERMVADGLADVERLFTLPVMEKAVRDAYAAVRSRRASK